MKPFDAYQLEELQQAREYIDKHWGCVNAHAVTRAVVFEDGQAATFLGLTHNLMSVCAVVLPFGESYVRLVHYSLVKPFPAVLSSTHVPGEPVVTRYTSEPNLEENKCAKNYDEDGGYGRKR